MAAPYLSSLSLSVTFTERTYSIHHYLIHSFYFSALLISLSELFTIGCQDTIVSCFSSFSSRCSTAVPFAFLLLSPPLNVGVPRGSPSGLSTLPRSGISPQSYNFIYVQDSQMSLSPAQTSSPKSDSYPTINLTPPWRSNTLRCPKSISQLSLHRPIFNLLSLSLGINTTIPVTQDKTLELCLISLFLSCLTSQLSANPVYLQNKFRI